LSSEVALRGKGRREGEGSDWIMKEGRLRGHSKRIRKKGR
jgi:hypothetical protein